MECNEYGLSNNDEDVEDEESFGGKEMLIFLIDCTSQMFQRQENMHFNSCLRVCKYSMLSAIRNGYKDLFGIVFFGTRSKDVGDQNPQSVTTFFDAASKPTSEIVKQLHQMIEKFDYEQFRLKYGHSDDGGSRYSIADALWRCSSMVTHCKHKLSSATIVLMTCHDNPHGTDMAKIIQAKKKASDLQELNIELYLLYFHNDALFDVNLFYKPNILAVVNGNTYCDDYHEALVTSVSGIDELPDCVLKKRQRKRVICRLKFFIGPDVFIGVEMYNFYRRRSLPTAVKLDRRDNEPLKSVLQHIDAETGRRLLPSDLNQYCVIAGERISFGKAEMLHVATLSKPCLTLLGFKSLRCLNIELHFRPSSFLYPSDDLICGGKLLFIELLEQCIRKEKFALCCLTSRYKGRPFLVGLVPQTEEQLTDIPTGFHVIYFPYAENIRYPPLNDASKVTPEQEAVFERIVRKLTCSSYTPSMYTNPKLSHHWRNVEALLLDSEVAVVDSDDDPNADYGEISERLGVSENEFENEFHLEDNTTVANKRKPPTANSSNVAKIKKSSTGGNDDASIEQWTVVQLKNYLKEKGVRVPAYSKKGDLINMAREYSS